jgi:hypothetical protein
MGKSSVPHPLWIATLCEVQIFDVSRTYRNIGVLQTTVAELITVKEHQRKWRSGGFHLMS